MGTSLKKKKLDLRHKAGFGTDTEPDTPWWTLEGCFHGETLRFATKQQKGMYN